MPLSFLAPAFLLGIAAIAVPLLVHLVQRERRDPIPFPSLMFLQRIPYRSSRRQRIRHWLLLALRCLALALIALAFARPFLDRRGVLAAAPSRSRELVILVDRSASMRYRDRWTRALAGVRAEIAGLGADDRATLIAFDVVPQALTERVSDQATLRAALATLHPGEGATRLEPALKLAARVLERSDRSRREAVLVSDFQRAGWRGGGDAHLPPNATLRSIDVSRGERADMAVLGADVRRARDGERETAVLSARLANHGTAAVTRVVHLDVAGREVQHATARVEAGGTATVEMPSVPVPETGVRATLRLDEDELPIDDAFHLLVARARDMPVLVIASPEADASSALFMTRALALGAAPSFTVRSRRADAVVQADLADRPLVILLDGAPSPQGTLAARLTSYVRGGGGVIVALGGRGAGRGGAASELLPAALTTVDRLGDRGGVLGYLERGHPALELFREPRSGDFSQARFYRYRSLAPSAGDRELARFDDGAVALLERRVGRGRVLVFASSLDGTWNDLPLQPVFLPFVHQLARYAEAWSERPFSYVIGQSVDPADLARAGADDAEAGVAYVVVTPSGRRIRFAPTDSGRRAALTLDEQGFYEIRKAGADGAPTAVIAANVDRAEADLAHVDPQEVMKAVSSTGASRAASAGVEELSAPERERRQSAWWYVLVALLVLLIGESLLAERISRRLSQGAPGTPA